MPSRRRYPGSTRTSYSVLGASKMHAMQGRPEIAERHGAGHVARCTARAAHGRPGPTRCQTRQVAQNDALGSKGPVPGRPRQKAFQRVQAERAVGRRHSPASGRYPSCVRAFCGWVYVAFVTDVYSRRIIGWQTTYRPARTDLALDALEMAVWQRKRQGADLSGLVHHLRPRRAVQVHPLRAGPVRVRGGRLGGFQRGTPFGFALAEALNSLYKAELIRNRGPWEDIDAASGRHR